MKRKSLSESDLRAVVGLLGKIAEVPGDIDEKKSKLMEGLCDLVGADRWAWGLARQMEPGKPNVHISLNHGGFTEETYPAFT